MISNPNDPAVKAVKRLAQRSRRDDAGVFLVEGPQAVRELLQHAPGSAVDVFYTSAFKDRFGSIVALAERSPATVDEVSEKVLAEMADTVTPQGVIAVAQLIKKSLTDIEDAKLIAICHEVRDPGNAGTVIRAADAAGAPVKSLDLQQVSILFISGAVVGLLAYLKQSPLPPEE